MSESQRSGGAGTNGGTPPESLTITFVHPTNLSETLTASVSRTATPSFLIEQLIEEGFIPRPASTGQYKLRRENGAQLIDHTPVWRAGVVDDDRLGIDHSVTGALRARVGLR